MAAANVTLQQPIGAIVRGFESQQRCKLVEQSIGWQKTVGMLDKLRHRGHAKVDRIFTFAAGVYDIVRIRTIERAGVCV